MGVYTKYYVLIILPLFVLGWSEWIGFEEFQMLDMLLVGLWVTGFPHGGLDHWVARQNALNSDRPFSWIQFFKPYLSKIILYGIIWMISPILALLLFVCLSALHFGEIDLQYFTWPHRTLYRVFAFVYGFGIVGGMLLPHLEEVNALVNQFPNLSGWNPIYQFLQTHIGIIEAMGITTLLIALLWLGAITNQWKAAQHSIMLLLVWWIIFWRLPLVLGFAVYFCCWHTILTFLELKSYLAVSWIQLGKKAIPYSGIAWIIIVSVIGLSRYLNHPEFFWPILFVALTLLAAPHVAVMEELFLRRRTEN